MILSTYEPTIVLLVINNEVFIYPRYQIHVVVRRRIYNKERARPHYARRNLKTEVSS